MPGFLRIEKTEVEAIHVPCSIKNPYKVVLASLVVFGYIETVCLLSVPF